MCAHVRACVQLSLSQPTLTRIIVLMFGHENLRAESPFTLHPGRGLYVGVSGNLHPGLCLSCSGPARSLRFVCTLFRQSAFKCLHLFALPGLRHADKKLSCTTRKGVSSSLLVARPFLRGVRAGGILGYRRSNCCTLLLAATGLPIKRKLYRSLLCFNNKRLISTGHLRHVGVWVRNSV